ncbi:MAG: hypothetical protein ACFB10_20135 [Salibacteraceae bacterium]
MPDFQILKSLSGFSVLALGNGYSELKLEDGLRDLVSWVSYFF